MTINATQPKTQFLQCLRERECPLAPTLLLVVRRFPQARFLQQPQDKAWPRLWQAALAGASSVLASRWSHIFTNSAPLALKK